MRLYCDRFVTFLSVLRYCFAVFCDVTSQNAVCDCFAVFCGVSQMFCERCFVQYTRFFLLSENARNTRAYCEFFVFFSVFRYFSGVLCVLWKYCKTLAKHRRTPAKHYKTPRKTPQNTRKTTQNTTKHHKTHLLTKQPEFANKPALARAASGAARASR